MKRPYSFLSGFTPLLFLFSGFGALFYSPNLEAQGTGIDLSGLVRDSAAFRPVGGVSVFLNNTSRGTITLADGYFIIKDIPKGRFDLVFSSIGYETQVIPIDGSHLPSTISVLLHTKATELSSVSVAPNDKDGWRKWGQYFLDNFIGLVPNASSCRIKNRAALRFHFSKKSNSLLVTASEPLIIENSALGYTIQYQLESFSSEFSRHFISFYGYPFFREMETNNSRKRNKWLHNRKEAYQGSVLNFMRSLYAGRLFQDNFGALRDKALPNLEKKRIESFYNPDTTAKDRFPVDSVYYFRKVLKQYDSFLVKVPIPFDSLISKPALDTRGLFFTGPLTILYGNPAKNIGLRGSVIRLVTPSMITVEENGNYYPATEMIVTGTWGQNEKIANLLPLDYGLY